MAVVNPLQYRSYYHDSETGFYYLQSRYYDPEICRFINADSYASTGQSYLGYNTFAYCGNDPVNRTDADGEFWATVFDIVSLGFSIADVIQNPSDPWAWAGLVGDVVDLVPFVTGVGELTKAAGAVADVADVIDDVHDTARALDNIEMKAPKLIQINYSSAVLPRGYIFGKRVHFAGRVNPGCFCFMEVAA